MMFKAIGVKPISRIETYHKYGFVITEHEFFDCPRCKSVLNAGPNYQPNYCGRCGQKVNFKGIQWREDRELGYLERGEKCEQVEN